MRKPILVENTTVRLDVFKRDAFLSRPLFTPDPIWPESARQVRAAMHLPPETPLRLQVVEAPLIDIASRDLRRRVREGHSIRYIVPRAVEEYIRDRRLYRQGT